MLQTLNDVTCQNQTNVNKIRFRVVVLSIEQVCDFHMIFHLHLYANLIQGYIYWNKVKYLTFPKSLNREKKLLKGKI